MNTFEAIETRRAVRRFNPTHRLTDAEEKKLFELAMLSPTSFNIQHWRFVAVRDPSLRQEIRAIAWDQAQVTDASLLVVLCADLKAWEKHPARYWRHTPAQVQEYMVGALDTYFRQREQLQRDETMRSCGIAAQTMMLAACAMGYDSCPMGGFDFDAMANLIRLPRDHVIGMMVAIGKALEPAGPRAGQLSREELVITDRFAS